MPRPSPQLLQRWMWVWLVAAGCGDDSAPPSSSGSESSTGIVGEPTTTTSTTGGTGSADSTSGSGATSSSGSSSTGLSDSSSSSSDSSGSESGSSSDSGTMPVMPCPDGCAVEFACGDEWRSTEACVADCEANLIEAERFNIACRAAWEDLHACLGTLSCEQFEQWLNPTGIPYPCLSEDEVLTFECAGQ